MNEEEKNTSQNNHQSDDIEFEEDSENLSGSDAEKETKKLKNQLKECKKEKQEYLDGWQRSRAEVVNLKKIQEDKVKDAKEASKEKILSEFIPVVDSFDMAFADKDKWEQVDENWRKGVEYIYGQLFSALEANGVQAIEESENFDPALHEPIETVDTDSEEYDNKIKEVCSRGYSANGRIIRPAKVKVFKYKK